MVSLSDAPLATSRSPVGVKKKIQNLSFIMGIVPASVQAKVVMEII